MWASLFSFTCARRTFSSKSEKNEERDRLAKMACLSMLHSWHKKQLWCWINRISFVLFDAPGRMESAPNSEFGVSAPMGDMRQKRKIVSLCAIFASNFRQRKRESERTQKFGWERKQTGELTSSDEPSMRIPLEVEGYVQILALKRKKSQNSHTHYYNTHNAAKKRVKRDDLGPRKLLVSTGGREKWSLPIINQFSS